MQFRLDRSGAFAVLTLAAVLSGCANINVVDSNEHWFSKPLDWTGRKGGYTFSELQAANDKRRPVTANELVSANGYCPPPPNFAAAAPPVPAPAAAMPIGPQGEGATAGMGEVPSLLGGGIALGMTECQVVYRAGTPASVLIGSKPSGQRTAVLTFDGGPRPGIYRFEGGRLMDMDRVEAPSSEPKVAKRIKKRRAPPEQQISTE